MKTSKKGYLKNSPDINKPQNIIKGGDITMKGVDFNVHGVDSNGYAKVMTPGNNYKFPNAEYVIETPIKNNKKMKPFTSKHCTQYLTKSSPLNQGLIFKDQDPNDPKVKEAVARGVREAEKAGLIKKRQPKSTNTTSAPAGYSERTKKDMSARKALVAAAKAGAKAGFKKGSKADLETKRRLSSTKYKI
jgi:hypothetical protein